MKAMDPMLVYALAVLVISAGYGFMKFLEWRQRK